LGGISPLDSLRATISSRSGFWIPRPSPPYTANAPRIGIEVLRKRIAGSVRRRVPPYVEIGETRYSAACLSSRYDLIGQYVYVHLPQDIRTVECYFDSGLYIGELKCLDRGWSLTAHSYENRKIVNALVRKGEMWVPENGDPMVVYLNHLQKKAITKAAANSCRFVSADASAVANLLLNSSPATAPSSPDPVLAANDSSVTRPKNFVGAALPGNWE